MQTLSKPPPNRQCHECHNEMLFSSFLLSVSFIPLFASHKILAYRTSTWIWFMCAIYFIIISFFSCDNSIIILWWENSIYSYPHISPNGVQVNPLYFFLSFFRSFLLVETSHVGSGKKLNQQTTCSQSWKYLINQHHQHENINLKTKYQFSTVKIADAASAHYQSFPIK